ncbi:thiopeptide-type bacteriocin biosynthesis protein [Streptomyces sp. NPDC058758]|uniref:thiopeptide-type bacteriocin biosynthesis protein n=1 Tax=Streptomyces sp. NPDC058758 TaxID=3346627 RepID=UPI003678A633
MPEPVWHQSNVAFADWASAEPTALTHLAPQLRAAVAEGTIAAWFFIRKHPCWRIRYQLSTTGRDPLPAALDALTAQGHITGWTRAVYEPETHAFGGPQAMDGAHRLFHHDSRGLTLHLQHDTSHRSETSLLMCGLMMRSAGLDWYEQGDVWARVSAHRPLPDAASATRHEAAVRRLITVGTEELLRPGADLARLADWAQGYINAGTDLRRLAATGHLHRGLRDVLAHHVLFAWNRAGLPHAVQAALSCAARTVVFGPDPTTAQRNQPHAGTA